MLYKIHYPYITFVIDSPQSIDSFFQQFHLSKKTIHLYKQNKEYTVNKRFVSSTSLLVKGDRLTIKAFQEDDGMYPPNYQDLDIVYEDDFILVINKPPFLNVFPDHKEKVNSLANRVAGYYIQQGYNIPVRFIHRLDYETSGLVLFCKCAFIQPLLDYQLSIKEISRHYLAVVEGQIKDKHTSIIDKPIGRDRHHNQKMRISETGKRAQTQVQCLSSTNEYSFLYCSLFTGRKHQIRVHLSSKGHPIVGDQLYGTKSSLINRQALHAYELQLVHPITKEKMVFHQTPPDDMLSLIHMIDPYF